MLRSEFYFENISEVSLKKAEGMQYICISYVPIYAHIYYTLVYINLEAKDLY